MSIADVAQLADDELVARLAQQNAEDIDSIVETLAMVGVFLVRAARHLGFSEDVDRFTQVAVEAAPDPETAA